MKAASLTQWIVLFALLGMAFPVSSATAEEWRLMGRHGGCKTLAEAAERKPVFSGVTTPRDLAARLRQQGVTVTMRDHKIPGGTAVALDAPAAGLALVLVPASLCRK